MKTLPNGRLPPLNALRTFEAAARHGSFVGAADELALTPSAISHRIKQLEDRLGVRLFERRPRDVVLTSRGKEYLATIQDAFVQIAVATDSLLGRPTRNVLTVGGCSLICLHWLLPRLDRLRSLRPHIEVRLATMATVEDLQSGGVDVLLQLGEPTSGGLRATRLFTDRLTVVGSASLFRRVGAPAEVAELVDFPIFSEAQSVQRDDHGIEAAPGFPSRYWNLWLRSAGLPILQPKRVYFCDTPFACMQGAFADMGMAIGWQRLLSPHLARGTLVAPFEIATECDRPFMALTGPTVRNDKTVAAFLEWIISEGAAESAVELTGLPNENLR